MRFFSWFFVIWVALGIAVAFFMNKQALPVYIFGAFTLTCIVFSAFLVISGVRKSKDDCAPFNLRRFLQKTTRNTSLDEFTGRELIGISIMGFAVGMFGLSIFIWSKLKAGP